METGDFQSGLEELIRWAGEALTVVMCAEALPFRCHRQLLSDALTVHGFQVLHILGPGRAEPHRIPVFARIDGNNVIYDVGTLDLPTE